MNDYTAAIDFLNIVTGNIDQRDFNKAIEFINNRTIPSEVFGSLALENTGSNILIYALGTYIMDKIEQPSCIAFINLLRENGFKLSYDAPASVEQSVYDCAMAVRDSITNQDYRDVIIALKNTVLWDEQSGPFKWSLEHFELTDFHGSLKETDPIRFKKLSNYFCDVSMLFAKADACLPLLKVIEEQLKILLPWLSEDPQPSAYLSDGILNFPLPPDNYMKRDKSNCLLKILADILFQDIPENCFVHAYGFIDIKEFNQVIVSGKIIVDQSLIHLANMHGNISHALQWAMLVIANQSGVLPFPEGMNLKDLLRYSVSDEIQVQERSVWNAILDRTHYSNFSTAKSIQSILMGTIGEGLYPHLCAYMRRHFWDSYFQVEKKLGIPLPILLFLDWLSVNLFWTGTNTMPFSQIKQLYEEKGKQITLYTPVNDKEYGVLFYKNGSKSINNQPPRFFPSRAIKGITSGFYQSTISELEFGVPPDLGKSQNVGDKL